MDYSPTKLGDEILLSFAGLSATIDLTDEHAPSAHLEPDQDFICDTHGEWRCHECGSQLMIVVDLTDNN